MDLGREGTLVRSKRPGMDLRFLGDPKIHWNGFHHFWTILLALSEPRTYQFRASDSLSVAEALVGWSSRTAGGTASVYGNSDWEGWQDTRCVCLVLDVLLDSLTWKWSSRPVCSN